MGGVLTGVLWVVAAACFISAGAQFLQRRYRGDGKDPHPFSMKVALIAGVLLAIAAVVAMLRG